MCIGNRTLCCGINIVFTMTEIKTNIKREDRINLNGSDLSFIVKPKEFKKYLSVFYGKTRIMEKLDFMSKSSDVYIFSGVIRDYFFEKKSSYPRDLDVVVGNGKLESIPTDYLRQVEYSVNQFGGVKLKEKDKTVDVWQLKDTWGIKMKKAEATPQELVNTAFFNVSAIAFDYGREKFIVSDAFKSFMNTRILDVVYEDNPFPDLCVVNTLYYSRKLNCKLSNRLSSWILNHYHKEHDYSSVQIKHFGIIKYSNTEIELFVSKLR